MKKTCHAFTLAEVLVTVGILGVVASLTMPTLITNYQKQTNVTLLRKTANDFANATDLYITEEGKTNFVNTGAMADDDSIKKFMRSKFKVRETNGFVSSYTSISGRTNSYTCSGTGYVLPSSAAVCITKKMTALHTPVLHVQIDVNGTKKPNIGGRDMFDFYIDRDGSIIPDLESYNFVNNHKGEAFKDNITNIKDESAKDVACKTNIVTGETSGYCKKCIDSPLGKDCYEMLESNNWKMTY